MKLRDLIVMYPRNITIIIIIIQSLSFFAMIINIVMMSNSSIGWEEMTKLLFAVIAAILLHSTILAVILKQYSSIISENESKLKLLEQDMLTGLLNRHTFNERLDGMRHEPSSHKSLSVLLIDVDKFKTINDNYGHCAGDEVLANIGSILSKQVRDGDLVCRYGGEEFVVVFKDLNYSNAKVVGERFLKALDTQISLEEAVIKFTVSIGLVYTEDVDKPMESIIDMADHCMYEAKSDGRNRICSQLM